MRHQLLGAVVARFIIWIDYFDLFLRADACKSAGSNRIALSIWTCRNRLLAVKSPSLRREMLNHSAASSGVISREGVLLFAIVTLLLFAIGFVAAPVVLGVQMLQKEFFSLSIAEIQEAVTELHGTVE